MKRVYLDQNKWIDLAAAQKGIEKGLPFEDVHLLLGAMVDHGDVSLPLSAAHYMETHNRRRYDSRRDLASTMAPFSRFHAIGPSSSVLPGELDRALEAMLQQPLEVRDLRPFGQGVSHAFGFEIEVEPLAAQLAERSPVPSAAKEATRHYLELLLLAGLPPEEEAKLPDYQPFAHQEAAKRNAREKESLREIRRVAGWQKGEKSKRVAKAQALTEYLEPLNEALRRARISADHFMALGQSGMTSFLECVPTLFAALELERLRETASQKAWERQDLTDLGALPVASVYCDVVVTEKLWVDFARRSELDERLETVFLSDLADLPAYLL
jgi:hypothetical protein